PVAPVVTARLRAPGLSAEGIRFSRLDLDARYQRSGWYGRAVAEQDGGGTLRLEARQGSEAEAAGARRGGIVFLVAANRFRLGFMKPLWNQTGGGLTHLDGRLNARLTATGTLDRPLVDGTIRLREGEARIPKLLRPLDQVEVTVDIAKSRATLLVNARSRPGKIHLEGSFAFDRPASSNFDLRLKA